jgi:hypothetical protein
MPTAYNATRHDSIRSALPTRPTCPLAPFRLVSHRPPGTAGPRRCPAGPRPGRFWWVLHYPHSWLGSAAPTRRSALGAVALRCSWVLPAPAETPVPDRSTRQPGHRQESGPGPRCGGPRGASSKCRDTGHWNVIYITLDRPEHTVSSPLSEPGIPIVMSRKADYIGVAVVARRVHSHPGGQDQLPDEFNQFLPFGLTLSRSPPTVTVRNRYRKRRLAGEPRKNAI